jgi:hypothetical protein
VTQPPPSAPGVPVGPTLTTFKDWRLAFQSDGTTAKYQLNQKFKVFTTTGRQKDGRSYSLVAMNEVGANGELLPPSQIETTGIFVDATKPHWMISGALQAGVALTPKAPGAVVGLQWLKRGRTKSAEDSTFAVFTPVIFLSKDTQELGVLPVSINLGRLPKQPLKDFWVSPYIDRTMTHFGVSITATF